MSSVAKVLRLQQRQALISVLLSACGRGTQLHGGQNFSSHSGEIQKKGNHYVIPFTERMIQKHIYPRDHEVFWMKERFPEPQQLVTEVYKPISDTDGIKSPNFYLDKTFGNNIYKGRLELQWPHTIRVTSSQITEEKATECAFLLACDLLNEMGFLQIVDGRGVPMEPNTVLMFLKKFAKESASGSSKDLFQNVNTLESERDEEQLWQSTLRLNWPVDFTVSAKAREMPIAFHEMCLLTAMKLKRLGFLDQNNHLKQKTVFRVKCSRAEEYKLEDFQPDAEIYVDASKVGMGAYLLSSDEDTIRWISDPWTDRLYFDPHKNSSVAEFYALVTALYTWKHKFINKKVLCYSDSLNTVNYVNNGLYLVRDVRGKRYSDPKQEKLFKTLSHTCTKNNITLFARHVPRVHNVAADLLSRNNVQSFQKIVPNTFHIPKKTKKLEFCKPRDDLLNPNNKKGK